MHDQHTTDSGAMHRLQVRGNTLLGDVPIHPKPIHPRPRLWKWLLESSDQIVDFRSKTRFHKEHDRYCADEHRPHVVAPTLKLVSMGVSFSHVTPDQCLWHRHRLT